MRLRPCRDDDLKEFRSKEKEYTDIIKKHGLIYVWIRMMTAPAQ